MPKRIRIPSGYYKGKYVLVRVPGEKIYCQRCEKRMAEAKYPEQPWMCRACAFVSPEGKASIKRIQARIKGGGKG